MSKLTIGGSLRAPHCLPGQAQLRGRARRATPPSAHHAFDRHRHLTSPPGTCTRPTGAVAEVLSVNTYICRAVQSDCGQGFAISAKAMKSRLLRQTGICKGVETIFATPLDRTIDVICMAQTQLTSRDHHFCQDAVFESITNSWLQSRTSIRRHLHSTSSFR